MPRILDFTTMAAEPIMARAPWESYKHTMPVL
jgi:hypothetical protein